MLLIDVAVPSITTRRADAEVPYGIAKYARKPFILPSVTLKGFRAAFVLKSNTPASVIKLVIDGTATGIEDLVIDGVKANGRVYNLNGQYVGNSLNGLQPGLYIQNGKKIVVK